jgi:histidine triad (HIT) family protein
MENCIFCKIIRREIPADILYENEHLVAFKDIQPQAPIHILVVPKKHITSLDDLSPEDMVLAGELLMGIRNVAAETGAAGGYKALTNCGEPAGQVVHHLHFHILAGKKFVP